VKSAVSIVVLIWFSMSVAGQGPIATLQLGPDRIGDVKTAQGITTMLRFTEPVQEIICGDLYDASSGKGTFVVQRSGTSDHPGNEVFVKPVASRGSSNMFVKTGEGKHTYSFDLSVVSPDKAHRMINVTDLNSETKPNPPASPPSADGAGDAAKPAPDFEKLKADAEQEARSKAAEIIRQAQQQADRKIAEAEARVLEADHQASMKAGQEVDRRFMQAMMLGLREAKVSNTRALAKRIVITVDPRVLLFDDKGYIRYTLQNTGDKDFVFKSLSLEVGDSKEFKPITIELNQSKPENSLSPGESLTGVVMFDPKHVGSKQKLMLIVRGDDSAELARLTVQE
jgi:type IV secretory pathway VirB9-like protein